MAKQKAEQIAHLMTTLDLTQQEAEDLWAFDNEETENEEATAIAQAAAPVKEKRSSLERVRELRAKKQKDTQKESVIETVFGHVRATDAFIQPQEITSGKISFKDALGQYYTVTVTKHKNAPNGYVEE